MAGLQKMLKVFGEIKVREGNKTIIWVWDYAKDEPRIKSEMTKEEFAESEKAKWMRGQPVKKK